MASRARGVRELDLWRRNRAFCPWQVPCTPPATGPSTWVCFPLGLDNCPPIRPRLDKIKYLAPAQATPGNPAPHWLRAERSKPSLHIPNGPQPGFTLSALLELEGGSEPSAGRSGLVPLWICLDGACACRTATGQAWLKLPPSHCRAWGPREPWTTLSLQPYLLSQRPCWEHLFTISQGQEARALKEHTEPRGFGETS